MGSAKNQSPECGDVTVFNLAWWYSDVVEVTRAARSLLMSGLSQADCLWVRDRVPGQEHLTQQTIALNPRQEGDHHHHPWPSGTLQRDRKEACSDAVPAAEAKKAGNASEDTRRIPRPPFQIGRVV